MLVLRLDRRLITAHQQQTSITRGKHACGHRRLPKLPMAGRRALTVVDVGGLPFRAGSASYARVAAASQDPGQLSRRTGQVLLLVVVLLWSTYGVSLRLIFSTPAPPEAQAITAARASMQAAFFVPVAVLVYGQSKRGSGGRRTAKEDADAPYLAGLELGLYNFAASGLQAAGLQYTTATRGALLILATGVFTPLLAQVSGQRLSAKVWAACTVVLVGGALIATDQHSLSAMAEDTGEWWQSGGDACILGAAFCYSLATLRLSHWAARVSDLPLAWAKSGGIAGFALAFLAGDCALRIAQQQSLSALWPDPSNTTVWVVLVWAALGPGTLAAWLQTKGQAVVSAAEAQVLYSLVPLPAGIFAALLPGGSGELLGPRGYLGGALVITASIALSLSQRPGSSAGAPEQQPLMNAEAKDRQGRASRRSSVSRHLPPGDDV